MKASDTLSRNPGKMCNFCPTDLSVPQVSLECQFFRKVFLLCAIYNTNPPPCLVSLHSTLVAFDILHFTQYTETHTLCQWCNKLQSSGTWSILLTMTASAHRNTALHRYKIYCVDRAWEFPNYHFSFQSTTHSVNIH